MDDAGVGRDNAEVVERFWPQRRNVYRSLLRVNSSAALRSAAFRSE
jgi:hypothetical protein